MNALQAALKASIVLAALMALPGLAATKRAWTDAEKLACRTQERLNELGWDAGTADGQVGAQTRDAISRYQSFTRLEVTGEPSEKLLSGLLLPCQIAMTNDWHTGESKSQAQFGCKNPQRVTGVVALIDLNPPTPQRARGPTCGRAHCVVSKPATLKHASLPLRYDGAYFERLDGMRRIARFFPDGTIAFTLSAMTLYEAPCEMSADAQRRAGSAPQPTTIEGDRFRWQRGDANRTVNFSGRVFEGGIELSYEGVVQGKSFQEAARRYEFVPDQP